ncbi:hypothetical protein N9X24_00325 [Rickettsiales bacterium]|nr:hypothetical protein [Rickettsiales bacterium]
MEGIIEIVEGFIQNRYYFHRAISDSESECESSLSSEEDYITRITNTDLLDLPLNYKEILQNHVDNILKNNLYDEVRDNIGKDIENFLDEIKKLEELISNTTEQTMQHVDKVLGAENRNVKYTEHFELKEHLKNLRMANESESERLLDCLKILDEHIKEKYPGKYLMSLSGYFNTLTPEKIRHENNMFYGHDEFGGSDSSSSKHGSQAPKSRFSLPTNGEGALFFPALRGR